MFKSLCVLLVVCLASVMAYSPAALADKIAAFPGQPDGVNFDMFSGYLDIANGTKSMFYHFYTSENGYENSPVVFTTSGGPGCDSIYFSFIESGAFQVNKDLTLKLRPTRFNKLANVVYLSQPVGVGFSIDRRGSGHTWTDAEAAVDFAEAMSVFYLRFPEISKSITYLNSESYGGHYTPTTAQTIVSGDYNINLGGFLVGNPLIRMDWRDYGSYIIMANNFIFPFENIDTYTQQCKPSTSAIPHTSRPAICNSIEREFDQYADLVDAYAVNYPVCMGTDGLTRNKFDNPYNLHVENTFRAASGKPAKKLNKFHSTSPYLSEIVKKSTKMTLLDHDLQDISPAYDPCQENYANKYFNIPAVQEAMHVVPESKKKWSTCSNIRYSQADMNVSMIPVYEYLMTKSKLKMVIMSGDNDSMCSIVETLNMFHNSFTPASNWKKHMAVDGQLSGFKRSYTTTGAQVPLHLVTVRNSGHMVPTTTPGKAFQIFEEFLNGSL